MPIFQVTVRTVSGQPLRGIGLRLLDPQGADITASRLGNSVVYTDATGQLLRTFTEGQTIALGNYSIVAVGPGYYQNNILTGDFSGFGSFSITMPPIPGATEIEVTAPESSYVSPLGPVEFLAAAAAPNAEWEFIEATVTNQNGDSSIIEVPVIAGQARLNLQARLELEPGLFLVGDGDLVAADSAFSDKFSITLASLTPTGRVVLQNQFDLHSANAFPIGQTNDLGNFTNDGDHLADWLTPWDELPKFVGHYADAMIWLPVPSELAYTLVTQYLTINRTALGETTNDLAAGVFRNGKVVHVRIPEPLAGAHYALLTIHLAGVAQTKPLTVRYEHG